MHGLRFMHAVRVVHDFGSLNVAHQHEHDEMVYLLTGRYEARSGGIPITLQPGQGVIHPAAVQHGCVDERLGTGTFVVFQWADGPQLAGPITFTDIGDRIGHVLGRLLELADATGPDVAAFRDLLAEVAVREALWLAAPETAPAPPASDPIARVRHHIEVTYRHDLTLEHLSRIAGTSRATLVRRFRARYATSPVRYLQEVRLRHARRLVESTALPMPEIAKRVGIRNPGHLGRLLKRATGCSVRELRNPG